MAEIKYNHAFGRLHAGIDLEIPLDRTIKTDISAQAKVDFDNYFAAANFPKIASTVSFLDFNPWQLCQPDKWSLESPLEILAIIAERSEAKTEKRETDKWKF